MQRGRSAIGIAAALALVGSLAAVRRDGVTSTEARAFRRANSISDRWFTPTWALMQVGSLGGVPVVATLVRWRRGRRRGCIVLVAGTGTWLAVKAVKPLIGRGRPVDHLERPIVRGRAQQGLGYPSGHAAVASVLASTATDGRAMRPIALAGAIVIGGGRIYIGAHLPLDVVGGLAIGLLAGEITRSITRS